MRIFRITDDVVYDLEVEVPKIGLEYDSNKEVQLDIDLNDTIFPFTRMCNSIGDWGIISALPYLLKQKYPTIKFLLPTPEYLIKVFGEDFIINKYSTDGHNALNNVDLIFANNPYVDGRFNTNEFKEVIIDHYRINRYESEPLVEKIIRYFGFTEEEIRHYDTKPQLYFSQEEEKIGNDIITKYCDNYKYGCLLFASRLEKYDNLWSDEYDKHLIQNIELSYESMPVFYYSSFDIKNTKWDKRFKEYINFKDIPEATIRIQMYIKKQARFNIGYQAGINDCIGGNRFHIISPYDKLGDNVIREYTYYVKDRSKIVYL
jgi:hypothetical protein